MLIVAWHHFLIAHAQLLNFGSCLILCFPSINASVSLQKSLSSPYQQCLLFLTRGLYVGCNAFKCVPPINLRLQQSYD